MFVISKVLEDTGNKEALVVCNGESYKITLHDLQTLDIQTGDRIDEEQHEQLYEAHQRLACIKKSFHYLSYGDMSARKLSDKLKAFFPSDVIEDVIELLSERKYLNDRALVQRYTADFYEFRKYGPARIKDELYKRGFNYEDINQAVESLRDLGYTDNILYLASKKFGSDFQDNKDPKFRQKLIAYLYRMGYTYEDVKNALTIYE